MLLRLCLTSAVTDYHVANILTVDKHNIKLFKYFKQLRLSGLSLFPSCQAMVSCKISDRFGSTVEAVPKLVLLLLIT